MEKSVKLPSVLAFERKISVTDGVLYSGLWDNIIQDNLWSPITVKQKSVRGTKSSQIKSTKDFDKEIIEANPQTVDFASLPLQENTIRLSYNVRIIGNLATPSACNDYNCLLKIKDIIQDFEKNIGFKELADRYAYQILAARPLWRNRVSASDVITVVTLNDGTLIQVNSLDYNLRKFDLNIPEVQKLGDAIADGFSSKSFIEFKVQSFALLGYGQEVFPSQEMILDKFDANAKSKFLYEIDSCAAMHSQKIGNAIRTIDTWYDDYSDELGPIPVESYGSVTTIGKAFRAKNTDFFTLFTRWIDKGEIEDREQKLYVIAMLIRGGVFGSKN